MYGDKEIHNPLSFNHSNEVPIASIKQSPDSNKKDQIRSDKGSVEILPSLAASSWPEGHKGLDARPRFIDGISKEYCLVDSGSAITAVAPLPTDTVRPDLALIAANGTLIECYGYRKIDIQIGRKTYSIDAAIAKVEETTVSYTHLTLPTKRIV